MRRKTIYTLDVASFSVRTENAHREEESGLSEATSTWAPKTYRLTNSIVEKSVSSIVLHVSLKVEYVMWCSMVWYGMVACICLMVIQVVDFMLITHSCDFLAQTLWLLLSHASPFFVNPSPSPKMQTLSFQSFDISVCILYIARLKWSFVGKLIAMLKTPSRTTQHKLPIACIVYKAKTKAKRS